jgi:hypothetical protein
LDRDKISETELITSIFKNNSDVNMKDFYYLESGNSNTSRIWIVYNNDNDDNIILYGKQYENFTDNRRFLNIYYYPIGTDISKKINDKILKGYQLETHQSANRIINTLLDRTDDSVWKMNFLFNKLFSILHKMQTNQKNAVDIIKHINQVSTMKFMHCEKGKLSESNMKYMNEIYNTYKEKVL